MLFSGDDESIVAVNRRWFYDCDARDGTCSAVVIIEMLSEKESHLLSLGSFRHSSFNPTLIPL